MDGYQRRPTNVNTNVIPPNSQPNVFTREGDIIYARPSNQQYDIGIPVNNPPTTNAASLANSQTLIMDTPNSNQVSFNPDQSHDKLPSVCIINNISDKQEEFNYSYAYFVESTMHSKYIF